MYHNQAQHYEYAKDVARFTHKDTGISFPILHIYSTRGEARGENGIDQNSKVSKNTGVKFKETLRNILEPDYH